MRRFVFLILWIGSAALGADRYPNFETLATSEKQGQDYRIVVRSKQNAATTVFAIHGGKIEPGTSELATLIAGKRFNLYRFEGIKAQDNHDLHITSTHFDEPRALALATKSDKCISIHGFKRIPTPHVCVGGANTELAKKVYDQLKAHAPGLVIQYPCELFPGVSPKNIVNRCKDRGVQLELSAPFREVLVQKPKIAKNIARIIVNAIN